jgi:hypothetical protein
MAENPFAKYAAQFADEANPFAKYAAGARPAARMPEIEVTAPPGEVKTTIGEDISQGALNLLGGALRGAGSIGATLIRPFESAEENRARRQQMTDALRQFGVQPESMIYGAGQIGTEIAGTLPIGGLLARGLMAAPGAAAVAPTLRPLATALETGGFRGGGLLTRAAGGATTGATGTLAVSPETAEVATGAAVSAAVGLTAPAALKAFAKGGGWLYDAVTQQLGTVKAAQLARDVAGGDLSAIKIVTAAAKQGETVGKPSPASLNAFAKGGGWLYDAATQQLGPVKAAQLARDVANNDKSAIKILSAIKIAPTAAKQGETVGQATANIPNAAWQAMNTYLQGRNTGSWWTKRRAAIEAETNAALDQLAGGATATESRAVQEQSKKALDAITTPMRETELAAAGQAGRVLPGLQEKEARFGAAAAAKVDDVRNLTAAAERADEWAKTWAPSARGGTTVPFGQPRVPERYTYPSELAGRAEQKAGEAAEASLRFGEVARDAAATAKSLEAYGLKPLKTDTIVSSLRARLADPDIATNSDATKALTRLGDMFSDWTNQFGVITPDAIYAIRKNGVNSVLADFAGSEAAKQKLAQKVLLEVRPLIDDAIEQAGGTGWRNYLKTYEQGMHGIEQKRMADYARSLYQSKDKQGFIDLIKGNNPKAVEDIFGPGRYDFTREMGGQRPRSPALEFMKLADIAERDLRMSKLAEDNMRQFTEILGKYTTPLNIPNFLNAKLTIPVKGFKEFQGRISKQALSTLEKATQDNATMAELLDKLPAKERVTALRIMMDSPNWNPVIQRGAAQAAAQMAGE